MNQIPNSVTESYTKCEKIAAYRAAHGGRDPPDPPLVGALKKVAPFFVPRGEEEEGRTALAPAEWEYP